MKKWFEVISAFIVVAVLYFLLRNIDFSEVWLLLININPFYLVLAILMTLTSFLIWNIRFRNSLESLVKGNFWFLFKTLLAGIFVNLITPGASYGGEPVRAHFIGKKYNKSRSKVLGCIIADKAFHWAVFVTFIILSLLFSLFFLPMSLGLKIFFGIILAIVVAATVIIAMMIFAEREYWIANFLRFFYRFKFIKNRFETKDIYVKYLKKIVKNFADTFRTVFLCRKCLPVGIILSVIFWILTYLISYFLFLSFGISVSFLSVVMVVSIGNVLGELSPVPGGLGFVEGGMYVLYTQLGIFEPVALSVALLYRIIYYIFGLFFGGVSLIALRRKIK